MYVCKPHPFKTLSCDYMSVSVYRYLWELEKRIWFPGIGIMGICELSNMRMRNQIWFLWKSSMALNHWVTTPAPTLTSKNTNEELKTYIRRILWSSPAWEFVSLVIECTIFSFHIIHSSVDEHLCWFYMIVIVTRNTWFPFPPFVIVSHLFKKLWYL